MPNRPIRYRSALVASIVLAAAALLGSSPAPAQAQQPRQEDRLLPPTPPAVGTNWSPLMSMLISIVLSGLVLGVAFIPSKRGHQD